MDGCYGSAGKTKKVTRCGKCRGDVYYRRRVNYGEAVKYALLHP